ncbi:CtIP type zinc knuckle (C2H2) [Cryptosporidium canis]|uniref:CtIP type zinc knuckle (C2H2) n=1 Tax=Cryptosporidium canis TaxID=195482 RepID=A0A9D5DI67_9CRYT|nr:CtIP type zinc knuckle (C2H2) [Cryptosporidium canis]
MDRVIDDDDYPSVFPLEKVASHLKMSLKLMEAAHVQWMKEKESLLHEIERLRMENRALRMEARNSENVERNSALGTPGACMANGYYLVNQESGRLVAVPEHPTSQLVDRAHLVDRSCGSSSAFRRSSDSAEIQDLGDVSENFIHGRNSASGSRSVQDDSISPTTGSQICKVRHIQLEDESNNHESLERKTIKYREVGKNIGKKEQRNCLQAFECTECSNFYKAISGSKFASSQSLCKHAKQSLLQNSGRHRFRHPPAKSPPGYWDLDEM